MKKLTQNEKIQSIEKSGLRKKEKKNSLNLIFLLKKYEKVRQKIRKIKFGKLNGIENWKINLKRSCVIGW